MEIKVPKQYNNIQFFKMNSSGRYDSLQYFFTGNSIKTVLEVSTVIMRKKRKFFCTSEVKEPIVSNKIICKVRTQTV